MRLSLSLEGHVCWFGPGPGRRTTRRRRGRKDIIQPIMARGDESSGGGEGGEGDSEEDLDDHDEL